MKSVILKEKIAQIISSTNKSGNQKLEAIINLIESLPAHPEKGEAKGMEEVLDRHEWLPKAGWTKENILAAMSEWASLVSAEKDASYAALTSQFEMLADKLIAKDKDFERQGKIVVSKLAWDKLIEKDSTIKELREAAKELDEYLSEETYENGKPVHLNYVGSYSILHKKIKQALNK